MGYTKNRILRIEYPELGDDLWLEYLNPMFAPMDVTQSERAVELTPDGDPMPGSKVNRLASLDMFANLIVRWSIPDPEDEEEKPLPLPTTAEVLNSLPALITARLMQEAGKYISQMNATITTTS